MRFLISHHTQYPFPGRGRTGRRNGDAGQKPAFTGLLLMLLLLLLPGLSASETTFIRFDHLTVEDGLSQNTVGSLLQDSRGFIWMGTEAGLERYDGHEFRHFRHDPDDRQSLADNFASALVEGRDGSIWVGTMSGGIHRLDPTTGRIERTPIRNAEPESHGLIWDLHVDDSGGIWAATGDGGLHKPADATEFTVLETPDDDDHLPPVYAPFISVGEAPEGGIVFGSPRGLARVIDGQLYAWTETENGSELPSDVFVSALFLDSRGHLWGGGGGVIFSISPEGDLRRYASPHPLGNAAANTAIWAIDEDRDGKIWITTFGSGLWQYDPGTEALRRFRSDPALPGSLAEDNLMAAMVDRSGLVWVGTESNGAQRINPRALQFGGFGHHPVDDNSLPHPVVWSIASRGNRIWAGTQDGLARLDWPPDGEGVTVTRLEPEPEDRVDVPEWHISSLQILDDRLWIGALSGGLWVRDLEGEGDATYNRVPLTELLGEEDPGYIPSVTAVTGDRHGNLFLTRGDEVIIRFRSDEVGDNGRWQRFLTGEDLSLGELYGLWANGRGGLWIAGEHGLVLYDLAAGRISHRLAPEDYEGEGEWLEISHGGVSGVLHEASDRVWLATQTGLMRVDLASGEWKRYDSRQGFPSDITYSLASEPGGRHLWVSSPKGLIRFDPETEAVQIYDVSDGLQSSEFNAGAVATLDDGRLAFGGLKGINVFDPADFRLDVPPPPLAITGATVGNRSVDDLWLGQRGDEIRMQHDDNVLSISFAALDFRNIRKNRFQYRLVGFDDEWRSTDGLNRAVFTNLPAGRFRFEVRAANSLGVWNEEGADMTVVVEPAPWFHPLAMVAYGLALVLLLGLGLHFARRKRARDRLIEREQERREIAENLHRLTSLLAGSLEPDVVVGRLFSNLEHLVSVDCAALFMDQRDSALVEIGSRGSSEARAAIMQVPERLKDAVSRCRSSGRVEPLESGELIVLGYPEAARSFGVLVPLRISGAGFGLLVLVRQGEAFKSRERDLLAAVGTQAMMALENASLFARVEELATTDGLTGLLNRRHFESEVLGELERAVRYEHVAALLMLDIDHFKRFNDQHGHRMGDDCLRIFAQLLGNELRQSDRVARYGGEEFVAYLPETTLDRAKEVAERIRRGVENLTLSPEVSAGELTVSIGIAVFQRETDTLESLVRRADEALYRAKDRGRNRIEVDE